MKLYIKYFITNLQCQMQYKLSFFLTFVCQILFAFSGYLALYFFMQRFHTVQGFSFHQVLLCYSVIMISFHLAECLIRGFDTFASTIANGDFDRMLVRPRGLIFQVISSKFDFIRLGRLLQAVIILAYAIPICGVNWSWDRILTLGLMIISGFAVFSGLFVVYATFCFFTLEGLEFMNILIYGGREFGRYPLSIYGEGILRFFTFVVPMALFQYYPLLYLIGDTDNRLYMLAPLPAFLFLIPCFLFWRVGLKHYKSTGS